MQSEVRLLGADTLDRLVWPHSDPAECSRRFLVPLVRDGPRAYVDNVDAAMHVLCVDDCVMPVVVPSGRPGNADVCSMHAHYVAYTSGEMARRRNHPQRLLRPIMPLAGAVLRACRADDVVYVNNWLLATNPSPGLTADQVRRATSFLVARFPGRAVVFRSVNPRIDRQFYEAIRDAGYRLIASRTVYLADPAGNAFLRNRDLKRDFKLLASGALARVDAAELPRADLAQITRLYRALYLDKHSPLNAAYNQAFIELAMRSGLLTMTGLKREGVMVAFSAYFSQGDVITGALIGYDQSLPQDLGLYRQAFALKFHEAMRAGRILNLSAGAGHFKTCRGAVPCIEYEAVFDRHLPPWRRFAYALLSASGVFQRAVIARNGVRAPTP